MKDTRPSSPSNTATWYFNRANWRACSATSCFNFSISKAFWPSISFPVTGVATAMVEAAGRALKAPFRPLCSGRTER